MWGQIISLPLGIWLMAAPHVLEYGNPAATNDWIVGPLVATFATTALWEITRELRRMNFLLGAWLLWAPWLLGYPSVPTLNSLAIGGLLIVLSFVHGKLRHPTGGGWASPWKPVG